MNDNPDSVKCYFQEVTRGGEGEDTQKEKIDR